MATPTFIIVSLGIITVYLTGYGSSLRVVVNPQPYDNTTKSLSISCIADGPEYLHESILTINIMKEGVGKTMAVVNLKQELKMGDGLKDNIKAEGRIHRNASNSFLTLTIEKPDRQDAGTYKCLLFMAGFGFQVVEETEMVNVIYRVCPVGWTHYSKDNTCIKAFDTRLPRMALSWSKARESCQTFGGDLVQIRDADASNFVYNIAKTRELYTYTWIGIRNEANAGYDFRYVDGSVLGSYRPWEAGQPSGDGDKDAKCVLMYTGTRNPRQWMDAYCSTALSHVNYVCSMAPRV